MSELTGVELSKKVAEFYGIPYYIEAEYAHAPLLWLHEDSARCFQLMIEHELDIVFGRQAVVVRKWTCWSHIGVYAEFSDNSISGLRTAILQCLVKMKEPS